MRYPTEVNLLGDARGTLAALLPLLPARTTGPGGRPIEKNVARWWETVEHQAMLDAKPVNPMRIVWELSQRLPENAIVAADSGSAANWYARDLRIRGDIRGSLSGNAAPRWARRCRTRSAPSSPTPTGRWSLSSVTVPCR